MQEFISFVSVGQYLIKFVVFQSFDKLELHVVRCGAGASTYRRISQSCEIENADVTLGMEKKRYECRVIFSIHMTIKANIVNRINASFSRQGIDSAHGAHRCVRGAHRHIDPFLYSALCATQIVRILP